MRCYTVNENAKVDAFFQLSRGRRGNYFLPVGDHGRGGKTVYVSKAVLGQATDDKVVNAFPATHETGNFVLTAYNGGSSAEQALVLLRVPAEPARKRVFYHIDEDRIVTRGRVVRQFGKRFHRWQELLVVLNPGDEVVVQLDSVFDTIVIEPLVVKYDGTTVTCEQRESAPEPVPGETGDAPVGVPYELLGVTGFEEGYHSPDDAAAAEDDVPEGFERVGIEALLASHETAHAAPEARL